MKKFYKILIKLFRQTFFFEFLRKIKHLLKFFINRIDYSMDYEKAISLGKKNSDKVFYLIGYYHDENFTKQGILSTWLDFMPKVLYALNKGYIPIIDMMNNYKPMMLDKNNI